MCPLIRMSELSKLNPSTCTLVLTSSLLLKCAAPEISSFYSSIRFSLYTELFPSIYNCTVISPTVKRSKAHSLDHTSPLAMVRFLCSWLQQNSWTEMSLLPGPFQLLPLSSEAFPTRMSPPTHCVETALVTLTSKLHVGYNYLHSLSCTIYCPSETCP